MQYILIIILILLGIAICSMFFFAYLAKRYYERARDKKLEAIKNSSPYREKKPQPLRSNKNDFKAKDKIAEILKEEEIERGGVTPYNLEEKGVSESKGQDLEIIGVAKPVGFWSKFVMNQKIGFIMARVNFQKSSGKGYWVNLIKAQAASQGKDQGKGR
jgi:hypothetical protein